MNLDVQNILDRHFSLNCPHCNAFSNITAISFPYESSVRRYRPSRLGIVYRCDACNEPIFLKFNAEYMSNSAIIINEEYIEVERAKDNFELKYLPTSVNEDFNEAIISYSNCCYNAFASMCRRTIQSAFQELGAKGKDKVSEQLNDMKDITGMDDDTYKILEQIIISGHDGAHPHLPKLSEERAGILLELMKDVLYQLFVRQAKIQLAFQSRKEAIKKMKPEV